MRVMLLTLAPWRSAAPSGATVAAAAAADIIILACLR